MFRAESLLEKGEQYRDDDASLKALTETDEEDGHSKDVLRHDVKSEKTCKLPMQAGSGP